MSQESRFIKESNKVGVKLIGGEEAGAIATVIARAYPEAEVQEYPAYISIEAPNRLAFNMEEISEELGRPYDSPAFLVVLSSYNGRISVEDEQITLTNEILA
jgi:hypothetical protein